MFAETAKISFKPTLQTIQETCHLQPKTLTFWDREVGTPRHGVASARVVDMKGAWPQCWRTVPASDGRVPK